MLMFDRTKIRKAINGVKIDNAPGPHGITPALMKMFCDQILESWEKNFSKSFEEGILHQICLNDCIEHDRIISKWCHYLLGGQKWN